MLNQRSDKVELLRIAEAVAIEKSIDKEIILNSMETAIQKAAKTRFGSENDIRAKINRESGDITLHKALKVVENSRVAIFNCEPLLFIEESPPPPIEEIIFNIIVESIPALSA